MLLMWQFRRDDNIVRRFVGKQSTHSLPEIVAVLNDLGLSYLQDFAQHERVFPTILLVERADGALISLAHVMEAQECRPDNELAMRLIGREPILVPHIRFQYTLSNAGKELKQSSLPDGFEAVLNAVDSTYHHPSLPRPEIVQDMTIHPSGPGGLQLHND